MKTDSIATGLYALFLIIGGTIGYFTAHSLPSLIMGLGFALLMGFCAWGIYKGCRYSTYGAIGLSALLLAFFVYRFWLTLKFFPSGMMSILTLGLLLLLVNSLVKRSSNTKP